MAKVKFSDWMDNPDDDKSDQDGDRETDFDKLFAVDKFSKKEKKSQLLLQLQKSYKGDDRFQLNKDFAVDDLDRLP